ncbi:hypothetical protein TNCV_3023071, partial [Trichonephila clavipes]
ARRSRRRTAGEIARHTTQVTGRPISPPYRAKATRWWSVARHVRCVPLTLCPSEKAFSVCREHRNWRDNEWGRYSLQMSRFSLSSDFHRILIWRERGSRNHPLEHH